MITTDKTPRQREIIGGYGLAGNGRRVPYHAIAPQNPVSPAMIKEMQSIYGSNRLIIRSRTNMG
jgi:hypothetical protein